jgi:hypothetical protein
MWTARILIALSAMMLGVPQDVTASPNDNAPVQYVVRRGDTLISLGQRYLVRPDLYKAVQQRNRIADPLSMPVGRVLNIPRNLLKYKPAKAKFVAVRGQVLAGQSQATVGQVVNEGITVSTAETSFATLLLDDGSRISLPSNSDIRIRRLRNYVLGGSLDYDFDVAKGGMNSTVIKHKSPNDRYQVRTPKAVSAVRGTNFQSRYDPASNKDFAEVEEGRLAVGAGSADNVDLPAGNGLALPADGSVIREALLAPPNLVEPGRLQADPVVAFVADKSADASGYRLTVATDAGFVDQVADAASTDTRIVFQNLGNGNYFVRARAISSNGIEGLPQTYAFKRRLNGVKASAGQGDDGYTFKWIGDGEGIRRHHFQLFRDSIDTLPIVDEASLESDRILISDLPPGQYVWRIGVVQYLDGEMATNWAPLEKLTVAKP